MEDGIPGNQVLSITQTSDGFIWLGTFYGIARFDGLHFTIFDDVTQGFSGGACYRILPGPDGSHWTAPGGKLTFYQNGEFQLVAHLPRKPRYTIRLICVTPDGSIAFSRRDIDTGHYSLFTANVEKLSQHAERITKDLGSNIHFEGDTDDQGQVWWRYQNEFGKLTPDGITIEAHIPAPGKIALGPISAKSGGVWFVVDGRIRRFHEGHWIDNEIPKPEAIESQILELVEDELGNIWIRTKQGKLRYCARGSDESYRLTTQLDAKIGADLLVDREGRLWAAGGIGGIGISRLRKRVFRNLNNNPILSGPIRSFLQTDNGELLIGADRGLTQLSRDQLTFPVKAVNTPKLTGGNIWALSKGPDSQITVGKYSLLGGKKRPHSNNPVLFSLIDQKLQGFEVFGIGSNRRITALCHDLAERIWIGSRGDGLARIDGQEAHVFTEEEFPSRIVMSLACDPSGTVWIGTQDRGLFRFQDNQFTQVLGSDGRSLGRVHAIEVDENKSLWLATGGRGIFRYRDGKLDQFTTQHGLPSNEITTIRDDQLGSLWFGSYNGIHRVGLENLDDVASGKSPHLFVNSFSLEDGLSTLQCTTGHPASYRTDDGQLWFATQKGVHIVNPSLIPKDTTPPPVFLDSIHLDGKPQAIPLNRNLNPVSIPANITRVEIHYTGISFSAPDELRFRYRLEGLAPDWTETGSQRSVVFQDLAPGSYQFRVTAANRHGVWNKEGVSVRLDVKGPYWRSVWFQTLSGLSLVGLITIGFLTRLAQQKRHQAQKLQSARDIIKHQELDRKRIAQELHDSLEQNLLVIKNRAILAMRSDPNNEAIGTALTDISDISSGSISEVRDIANNLRPYQIDRLGIRKAIQGMLNKIDDATPLTVMHEIEPLPASTSFEFEINIYRIIQEALNNILKHANAGQVIVTLIGSEGRLSLRIKDDGVGFTPDRSTERESDSLGLRGIRERSSMFHGVCELITSPGAGTEWIIRFPIQPSQS
ncbi:histidine kinase [Verrucomicrobia bacterium]|nr:histidine kinase [Verrucomicrobiota bacterium]